MADKTNKDEQPAVTEAGTSAATDVPKKLPATTPAQEEQNEALAAASEDDGKETPAPETNLDDGGLDELPEGAVLAGGADSLDAHVAEALSPVRPQPQAAFRDDHVGQGGSYVVGDDGVRRPAYEAYYVPAPGKRGDRGERIRKFRRVA